MLRYEASVVPIFFADECLCAVAFHPCPPDEMLIATCALDKREVGLWRLCTKGRFTLKKYDVEPADADVTSL